MLIPIHFTSDSKVRTNRVKIRDEYTCNRNGIWTEQMYI